jgi:hypothetical protein
MNPPLGMGAKPRTIKPTDYHPDSFKASATPTPLSYFTPLPEIVYMQNQQPCCGADATTQYLNILFGCVGSPEFTWKNVRYIDGLPATDGSASDTLAKEAQRDGTCDLSLMNDNSVDTAQNYASYTGITPQMIQQGQTRKIANYAFIDKPTFQQTKDNIFLHKAVMLRVSCGDGWWTNGWEASAVCPVKVGNYVDDHWILCYGFDETYIYFVNSWSTSWGNQGKSYFDSTYPVHELVVFIPPIVNSLSTKPVVKYQFTQDFGYGTTSADVHALQTAIGMPSSLTTGYFGLITSMYVWAFKYKNGIKPYNGQCDLALRQFLNS